jgi:hypothetical protein
MMRLAQSVGNPYSVLSSRPEKRITYKLKKTIAKHENANYPPGVAFDPACEELMVPQERATGSRLISAVGLELIMPKTDPATNCGCVGGCGIDGCPGETDGPASDLVETGGGVEECCASLLRDIAKLANNARQNAVLKKAAKAISLDVSIYDDFLRLNELTTEQLEQVIHLANRLATTATPPA